MLALVSNQNFTLRGHSLRSKIKKLDIFEISKNTLILISQVKVDINQKFNSLEWYLSQLSFAVDFNKKIQSKHKLPMTEKSKSRKTSRIFTEKFSDCRISKTMKNTESKTFFALQICHRYNDANKVSELYHSQFQSYQQ